MKGGGGVIEKWEEVQFIGGRWGEGQLLCEKYVHMREESGYGACFNLCGRNVCAFYHVVEMCFSLCNLITLYLFWCR